MRGRVLHLLICAWLLFAANVRAQVMPAASVPPTTSVSPAASASPIAPGAVLSAEVIQQLAIQNYLLYTYGTYAALAASGAPQATQVYGPDAAAYFNNGAALLTVPSGDQPGAAYFSNGASVLSVNGALDGGVALPAAAAPDAGAVAPVDAAPHAAEPPEASLPTQAAAPPLEVLDGSVREDAEAGQAPPPTTVVIIPPTLGAAEAEAAPETPSGSPRGGSATNVQPVSASGPDYVLWVPAAFGAAVFGLALFALFHWRRTR